MVDKEKLTLMYKDFAILSFEADYVNQRVRLLEKLERFDLAPYGVTEGDELNAKLSRFFSSRAVASQRQDHDAIVEATGCRNAFELSFKGHGLSLANHYWFQRAGEPFDTTRSTSSRIGGTTPLAGRS